MSPGRPAIVILVTLTAGQAVKVAAAGRSAIVTSSGGKRIKQAFRE